MKALEADGLGKVLKKDHHRGTSAVSYIYYALDWSYLQDTIVQVYQFEKTPIPQENLEQFATKLSRYGISLTDYQRSLQPQSVLPT